MSSFKNNRFTLALLFLLLLAAFTIGGGMLTWPADALVNACTPLTDPAQIPAPTQINFDDLADGNTIGDYYQAAHGVRFEDSRVQHAEAVASVLAHSRLNVAMNVAVDPNVSNNSPLLIQFDDPKTDVGFYVGNSGGSSITAVLRAFDINGDELCFYDIEPVPDNHTLFMGVNDSTGSITSVTLDYGDTEIFESIDDLYFSASPPSPTATFTPSATATPTKTPTATPQKRRLPPLQKHRPPQKHRLPQKRRLPPLQKRQLPPRSLLPIWWPMIWKSPRAFKTWTMTFFWWPVNAPSSVFMRTVRVVITPRLPGLNCKREIKPPMSSPSPQAAPT
ncbi:MAG: hypothetical protein M5U34_26180 [Chloroflexi bacterium]|nr:hypothetical protein [Chloroflexota bacterium]